MERSNEDDPPLTPTPTRAVGSASNPWGFSAIPRRPTSPAVISDRPRTTRHSSVPRALFAAPPSSIFGSGDSEFMQQSDASDPPPLLAFSPPSSENVLTSPPTSAIPDAVKSRDSWYEDEENTLLDRRRIARVEKDADDPTAVPSSSRIAFDRQESTTLTTLSRLFAVRAPVSPEASRRTSFIQAAKPRLGYARSLAAETAALPDHLYNRGLLQGRHSDITINAFGQQYKLHRLILDRAPFFRSALSEPWLEANAKETTIRPEEMDATITQSSFELALKRLYGCGSPYEEDRDAVGLFATGCWLEMQDLVESSVESMLRQMTPEILSPLIKLVTSNYYGRAGDKILASAKAMLCRDGWKMPLKFWDGIPGDIVREIVGGDGFYIDGEWDRWVLAKKLLDRRLKQRALEAGLVESGTRRKLMKAPYSANVMAVRFDAAYRKSYATGGRLSDKLHRWITLYTLSDVEPLLVLLDEGIHYLHLDFEQLQFIRHAKDVLGLPVMPEKVVSNALWQQMELRQRVMNARETEMELNMSVKCTEDAAGVEASKDTTMSITTPASPSGSSKGKHKVQDAPEPSEEEDTESGSWDGNGKPRKFWIPSSDCNIVMGGNADPIIATSNNTTLQRHASRLSATIQPEDMQWVSDFAAITSQPRHLPASGEHGGATNDSGIGEVRYTYFPPFRFAAEFPNPRLLKEKKRVYSRTVFYAGSLWNIYIQKVKSSRTTQLGVYLHRAKERETEEVIAGTAGLAQGSVDERIGQLERSMILGSEERERRQRRRATTGAEGFDLDGTESSGSAGDVDTTFLEGRSSAKPNSMRGLLSRARQRRSEPVDPTAGPSRHSSSGSGTAHAADVLTPDSNTESSDSETERLVAESRRLHVPTLPPYVDARPTIKTYFKIYSPSRGGRMLSVYESAPDRFNFSQSWGWKSSTLMLDEGLLGGTEPMDDRDDAPEGEKIGSVDIGSRGLKGKGDGKLRFMVVIGNI